MTPKSTDNFTEPRLVLFFSLQKVRSLENYYALLFSKLVCKVPDVSGLSIIIVSSELESATETPTVTTNH